MKKDELRTLRAYAVRAHAEHPEVYGSEEIAKVVIGNLDDLIFSTTDEYTPTPHGAAIARLTDVYRLLMEIAIIVPDTAMSVSYQTVTQEVRRLITTSKKGDAALRGQQTRRATSGGRRP